MQWCSHTCPISGFVQVSVQGFPHSWWIMLSGHGCAVTYKRIGHTIGKTNIHKGLKKWATNRRWHTYGKNILISILQAFHLHAHTALNIRRWICIGRRIQRCCCNGTGLSCKLGQMNQWKPDLCNHWTLNWRRYHGRNSVRNEKSH